MTIETKEIPNEPLSQLTGRVADADGRHGALIVSKANTHPISEAFKTYVHTKYPSFASHARSCRAGLTLFAGGTGSGKSIAMHLAAQLLSEQGEKQLFLIGDGLHGGVPSESLVDGLEAARRLDPSVVGVDEIRSGEEARVIMELVDTGYPVWACIHAFAEDYGDQMQEQVDWLKSRGADISVFL